MRDEFVEQIIRAVQERTKTAPGGASARKTSAHERVSDYPPAKLLRGTPFAGRGIGGTRPGSDPAHDADLSARSRRAEIVEALQQLAGFGENGDPLPRQRSKLEIAGIVEEIDRELDDAIKAKDLERFDKLYETCMFEGHADLKAHPDENWRLMSSYRMGWLKGYEAAMAPKERRSARDAEIEDAIRQHPEMSARKLSVSLYGHERRHDTINRVKKRLERTQMNTVVTEIKQHVDQRLDQLEEREARRERLESMRAESMDRVRQTVEELAARFPADPRGQEAVEGFLTD
jgi:hypothetical protein